MVSKASEDLPDPDSPVMTTSALRGIATETSRRLCSRAPETTIWSAEDITPFDCREAHGCSPQKTAATSGVSGTPSRSGAGERDHAVHAGHVDLPSRIGQPAECPGAQLARGEGMADPAEVGGVEEVGDALLADRERPAPRQQGRAHRAEVGVRAVEVRRVGWGEVRLAAQRRGQAEDRVAEVEA